MPYLPSSMSLSSPRILPNPCHGRLAIKEEEPKESQRFRPILDVTTTLGRFCRETNSKTAATYRDTSCRQARQIGDHEREEWRVRDARKPMGKESAAAIHRRSFRKSHPQRTGNKARQNCHTRLIEGLLPHHIYISLFEPSRIPVCLPAPRS